MKYLHLFITGIALNMNVFAATGTGHSQAELTNPLSVSFPQTVNFGSIAIDPGAGAQTITLNATANSVICPSTYVCSTGGVTRYGIARITGMPSTLINVDITGSTATLSDGLGNTLIFDPIFQGDKEVWSTVATNPDGTQQYGIGGTIDFTGNETAGTYNTTNTGGSGYTVTVNY